MVVDVGGVVPGDGDAGKELAEQSGARLGELVQDEPAPASSAKMASSPVPAEGSSTTIGGRDRGGRGGDEGRARSAWRTAAAPGSPRSGAYAWAEARRPCASIGSTPRRRRGLRADGWAELAQEQDRRRLAGVVGGLPVPGAGGVGAAEGALHGGAQCDRVDALAAFEMRQKKPRGVSEAMRHVGFGASEGEQRRVCSRWSGNDRHGETSGERERVEPRGALSDPAGSNPSRPSSSSHCDVVIRAGHLMPDSRQQAARPIAVSSGNPCAQKRRPDTLVGPSGKREERQIRSSGSPDRSIRRPAEIERPRRR